MKKLQIVIPIGVAAPGTPVQNYFEEGINSLLEQTYEKSEIEIWIASDTNAPDRIKNFIKEKDLKVKWFSDFYYFRKGGIWKKIFDTWRESDSEYVAFMHYDDKWDSNKAFEQIFHIENEKLNGSWSQVYVIDANSNKVSEDVAHFQEFSESNLGGRTMGFAHSFIVNRDKLMTCGITDLEDLWSAQFEDIWSLYMHRIGNMKKTQSAKFYWRDHSMSISRTAREDNQYVVEQRKVTGYSVDETFKDADTAKAVLINVINEIRSRYRK